MDENPLKTLFYRSALTKNNFFLQVEIKKKICNHVF